MFDADRIEDYEVASADDKELQQSAEQKLYEEDYEGAMKLAEARAKECSSKKNVPGEAAAVLLIAKAYHVQGKNDKAKESATEALGKFKTSSSAMGEAIATATLAKINLDTPGKTFDEIKNSLEEAKKCAKDAQELFQKTKSGKGEAGALNILAKAYLAMGQSDEALDAADTSLNLFVGVGEYLGQTAAMITKALVCMYANRVDELEQFAADAVKMSKQVSKMPSAFREAQAMLLQAIPDMVFGRYDGALKYSKGAHEIHETQGAGTRAKASSTISVAYSYLMSGDLQEASTWSDKAVKLTETTKDKYKLLRATSLSNAAMVARVKFWQNQNQGSAFSKSEFSSILDLAGEAAKAYEEGEDMQSAGLARLELATLNSESEDYSQALTEAGAARTIFESSEDLAGEAVSLLVISELMALMSNSEEALNTARRALKLFKECEAGGDGSKAAAEIIEKLSPKKSFTASWRTDTPTWGPAETNLALPPRPDPAQGGVPVSMYKLLYNNSIKSSGNAESETAFDGQGLMYMGISLGTNFPFLRVAPDGSFGRQLQAPPPNRGAPGRSAGAAAAAARVDLEPQFALPKPEEPEEPPEPKALVEIVGKDILGGRLWDTDPQLHEEMVAMAARGEVPLSSTSVRKNNMLRKPTFHGPAQWKDAVKNGYLHPSANAPSGMKWRNMNPGWKLVGTFAPRS